MRTQIVSVQMIVFRFICCLWLGMAAQGAQGDGPAARPADADEVLLLGEADLEGMSPQLLMVHIRLVQEELLTKVGRL
jgi:hypothetical protein